MSGQNSWCSLIPFCFSLDSLLPFFVIAIIIIVPLSLSFIRFLPCLLSVWAVSSKTFRLFCSRDSSKSLRNLYFFLDYTFSPRRQTFLPFSSTLLGFYTVILLPVSFPSDLFQVFVSTKRQGQYCVRGDSSFFSHFKTPFRCWKKKKFSRVKAESEGKTRKWENQKNVLSFLASETEGGRKERMMKEPRGEGIQAGQEV